MERINKPKKRLHMYGIGDVVQLKDYEKEFTVAHIRDDGYYELCNNKGRIVLTASKCHEVK